MIDGIRQNLTMIDQSARKSSKPEALVGSASAETSVLSSGAGAELVEISTSMGQQASSAPIDRSKVEAIRTAIRNNSYPVDFDELSKRMVETMMGPSGRE